ncbi:MAG: hypothetical protein QNJ41_00075 [Xenococcaceae cyanobacterium MO_188.B32]|nr:hypothetical protein [Xenococcaceae cyanobacterium MO_188.B32]
MKNNTLIELFNRPKHSAGYTLTELIIGAGISVVVIGAAGMGLMNLMRGNNTSTNQADRRAEVNRALEFISDEVRRAETIELNPGSVSNLPSGFGTNGEEAVLALDVPNLGQKNPDDKVIYYVKPKPNNDNTWLGPNIIYRYGPPLDTSGGSYTNGNWVDQALIDRVNNQTITPSCSGGTAIPAKGFAACVDSGEKIAKIYVNGKFSGSSSDEYKADMQVYARAEAEHLDGEESKIDFEITKSSNNSTVKIIASQMGCSSDIAEYNSGGGKCTITTDFKQTDGTLIATVNSGSSPVNIGTNSPFKVTVAPSTTGLGSPFSSYFDVSGNPQTGGEQNNNKAIEIEIDLSKDYLNENPVTVLDTSNFSADQVKLLGDKSQFSDIESWNLNGLTDPTKQFKKLKDILKTEGFLDKDDELKLKSNQYLLVFEIGQKDPTHPGFDLQDQIILVTVQDN